jgi:heme oxygenase
VSVRLPVHEALREGTRDAHDRVDAAFGAFDLSDPSDYRRFLRAHARAFIPVEQAIDCIGIEAMVPDWTGRRRADRILADLQALEETAPDLTPLKLTDTDAALGALYVLEGSRLGGAMLARRIPADLPRTYLGTAQTPGAWRKLLEILGSTLYSPESVEAALASARAVFDRFEAAARAERGMR